MDPSCTLDSPRSWNLHDCVEDAEATHSDLYSPVRLDGSVERVEELRSQLARHETLAAHRREVLAGELARQEALWSAREAARLRRERVELATLEFNAAKAVYQSLSDAAVEASDALYAATCQVAILFRNAVQAELAQREVIPALVEAERNLRDLIEHISDPADIRTNSFDFGSGDIRIGVEHTALIVYPELRRMLIDLRSRPQASPPGRQRCAPRSIRKPIDSPDLSNASSDLRKQSKDRSQG